jgi:predicted ATPase
MSCSNYWPSGRAAKSAKVRSRLCAGGGGNGKSRLCEVFLDCIAHEPHTITRYQCSPQHTNSAFYPVIRQFEYAAHFERGDTPDVRLSKLKSVLSQVGTATAADARCDAALLSMLTGERHPNLDVTPQRQKDLAITAVIHHLVGQSDKRPVVVELADTHWIDSSTLELVSRSIVSLGTARVLMLISFRPEFFPQANRGNDL